MLKMQPKGGLPSEEFMALSDGDKAFVRAQEVLERLRERQVDVPHTAYQKLMSKLGFNDREAEEAFEDCGCTVNSHGRISYSQFRYGWEAITKILAQWGQLDENLIGYFWQHQAGFDYSHSHVSTVMQEMSLVGFVEWHGGDFAGRWSLADGVDREDFFPEDLGSEIHVKVAQLYIRYAAIRNQPELATVAESIIDMLYNPAGIYTPEVDV